MMIESSKPRKQRRYRFGAPLHARQHFLHAHISKELGEKLKLTKRSLQIAKGDSVKVVSGGHSGSEGKVTAVNLRKGFVYIDSIKRKNAKGKEISMPVHVSNVYITDLNLSDKIRAAKVKSFQKQK
ncbi:MAG: 50S ribosomal protein L24 [Candidatus Marsarchaeota archaeon]|jgi:large subunit ribosomal protein L24|nr:50S ribosomal protein L24 [Candidatus Marsarchaeota archaeon]